MQLNATIEITPAEIERLVIDYVRKETGNRDVSSVRFDFRTITMGSGVNEHDEHVFTGAIVRLTPLSVR
jgi:hypothetical protein